MSSFVQILQDKKQIKALAEAAKCRNLDIADGNGVFSFDFGGQSLLTNHRRTYDTLMELGGEELLSWLLSGGKTCLTDDPQSARQGIRPIQGTDRFFLQTNAGEPKVLTSILFGIAGWAEMDEGFDLELITLSGGEHSDAGDEWLPLDWEFKSDELEPINPPVPELRVEFERVECLEELEDGLSEICIVKKDGWWAVAEVDMRGMPRISKMLTPFAFTSIVRKEGWFHKLVQVERFGKKGAYNWEKNTYPIPCEYESICLQNPKIVTYYKASLRGETHVYGFWGEWIDLNAVLCPACGAAQSANAVCCKVCGKKLKEEEKAKAPAAQTTPLKTVASIIAEPEPEKKEDPDIPTLDTFKGNFLVQGSTSQVLHGRLSVTVQYNDDTDYDTEPEHFLYGNFEIAHKVGDERRRHWRLTGLSAYALAKDGLFYAKDDTIWFMNTYGDIKYIGEQSKVIGMTDDGKGVLTVEYVTDYHLWEARAYSTPMDMWEIWSDIYKVNTKKAEFRY